MPNFFINVKEKGAKKAAGNIKSLTSSMKMMALQAVTVTAVVQGLKKSIQMSAEMEGVRRGFDNLAKSQGFSTAAFNKFKKATDGTIDSLTLMKQANNAMLLGITDSEDQMADMFDVAQRLGAALGVDTVQAVESLVTGLGRQSKLMLDNLGIMVDTNKAYEDYADSIGKTTSQLTDQERKTAFVNAAMAEANMLVAQLGEEQLTTKDAMAQAATAASDVAVSMGNFLAPAIIRASTLFAGAGKAVSDYLDSLIELDNHQINAMSTEEEIIKNITRYEEKLRTAKTLVHTYSFATQDLSGATEKQKEEMARLRGILTQLNLKYHEGNILLTNNRENYVLLTPEMETMNTSLIRTNETTADYLGNLKKVEVQQMTSISSWDLMTLGIRRNTLERARNVKANLKGYALSNQGARDSMINVVKAETMEAISGLIASIFKNVPFPLNAILAAGAGGMVSSAITRNLQAHVPQFATGADFVTSGPQLMLAGEAGAERVQITPLNAGMNLDGPQGGGTNITLNISAPLVDDTVVDTIIPAINEAIRRGETLATS